MVKEFAVRWTVSRGQDTYGYNICTIVGEGIKGRRRVRRPIMFSNE